MYKSNSKFILRERVLLGNNIHKVIGIHYTIYGTMYKVNNMKRWIREDELQEIKSRESEVRKGKNTKR